MNAIWRAKRGKTMDSNPTQQLTSALRDWESQYLEVQPQLSLTDLYVVWLCLFRLSRQLTNDYKARLRTGGWSSQQVAYTGETERLQ
jgi:hypothetical protein